MTIQVPFRLRRRSRAEPAGALFFPSRDPAALFAPWSRDRLDPPGRIFDVAGGFLLELGRATNDPVPGAIRLRALAQWLYIPVDADLVPSLRDDEATGLARDWGIVFLPGGRALLFDHHAPVELSSLFSARPRPRRAWSSFPEPRRLPDRIARIALELPEQAPEMLYRQLNQGVAGPGGQRTAAEDGTQPDTEKAGAANTGSHAVTDAALGGALVALAGMIHSLRALVGQTASAVAGLKEKAQWEWVDHSALLRKLVREFREGDPTKALRRAIPISAPGDPIAPGRAIALPWVRAIYNLEALLSRPGRGETTPALSADPGLLRALAQEYRKAAERAAEQGDYRRAAYIHGVLLRDDRAAARALQRGGLHHDAAILYLAKLDDPASAAQAFEAAGEVDRAITLYQQLGRHEEAGDLLRRIGEEALAVAEFECAAALLVASSSADYLAAGRLLLEKARRPDRAIDQFQAGWALRPRGNAVLCALELTRIHAQRGEIEPIRELLDQADALFESPGKPYDGFFYNEVARLALLPTMAGSADELRDRSLQSVVRKLRRGVGARQSVPAMVSALLGRTKLWPAALVSDAEFAATAELKRARAHSRAKASRHDPRVAGVRVGRGTVTAVCQARVTGELFLGFDSGQVLAYRPAREQVVTVADEIGPLTGLAVDPEGSTVVALHRSHSAAVMSSFRKHPDGSFRPRAQAHSSTGPDCWLTPILPWGVERLVGLSDGRDLLIVDAVSGMVWQRRRISNADSSSPITAVLLPIGTLDRPPESRLVVLTHDGPSWVVVDIDGKPVSQCGYRWQPAMPSSSTLRSVPLSWRFTIPYLLEVLGLDKNGAVYSARFHAEEGVIELLSAQVANTQGGYLAAARTGPSSVIAVSPARIDWLDCGGDRLHVTQKLDIGFPTAVACFAIASSRESLVVCSDGFIARVDASCRSAIMRS